jgi:N-acetylneuraminate synthase
MKKISLGNTLEPYIIAEIGVNHEGCMKTAKRLIYEAKLGGADAAKFQSYKAELLASKDSPAYWDTSAEPTTSQYKLFKKFDSFGPEEYVELASYCKEVEIDFMSTPFDLSAVDFLDELVPAFKIASADITNIPLIRKCAATSKPLIMSTGASSLSEIEFAIDTAKKAGAQEIAILHCVLNYPTPIENAQLGMIKTLMNCFPEVSVGYSDHVCPDETISSLEVATLMGSVVIEKHFTHDKSLPGNDHYHSMDKIDLIKFKEKISKYRKLVSDDTKDLSIEKSARINARRSLVAAKNLSAGDKITEEMLIAKRPGTGISPIHWDELIGMHLVNDIKEDSKINWYDLQITK